MFYEIEKIHPNVTRIWDVSRTAMYLVEGSEAAVLVDTGVGVGSLKAVVEGITDKPVTVLLTHGHVDHAMGAGEFEQVYMNPADRPIYGGHSLLPVRQGYVSGAAMSGGNPELIAAVKENDFTHVADADNLRPLQAGAVFALGGVSVEVFDAPGHTPGSVVMLIPELRMLLLGDACNAFTYLFDKSCPTVAEYKENLLKLKAEVAGKYDRTLYSHGMGEGAPDMIDRVIAVCDDIMEGRVDNMPFRGFSGEPVCIAKAMDFQRFCRADGGEGNIVYDPNRIK